MDLANRAEKLVASRHLILVLAFGLLTGLGEQPRLAQGRGRLFYPRFRLVADQGKGAKPGAPRNNFVNPRVNRAFRSSSPI